MSSTYLPYCHFTLTQTSLKYRTSEQALKVSFGLHLTSSVVIYGRENWTRVVELLRIVMSISQFPRLLEWAVCGLS